LVYFSHFGMLQQEKYCETAGLTFDKWMTRMKCLKWMYSKSWGMLIYQSVTSDLHHVK
jgi:hypothetical protein